MKSVFFPRHHWRALLFFFPPSAVKVSFSLSSMFFFLFFHPPPLYPFFFLDVDADAKASTPDTPPPEPRVCSPASLNRHDQKTSFPPSPFSWHHLGLFYSFSSPPPRPIPKRLRTLSLLSRPFLLPTLLVSLFRCLPFASRILETPGGLSSVNFSQQLRGGASINRERNRVRRPDTATESCSSLSSCS